MNNADRVRTAAALEEEHLAEPGIGAAMLAVLVMLLATVVLFGLVYILMVAITPIEARHTKPAVPEMPAVQQQDATPPVR